MQNELIITGNDVVAEARTWMDTPFVHQAAIKGLGCDCIGLIRGIGRDLEICDFDQDSDEGRDLLNYTIYPEPKRLIGALNKWFIRVRDGFQNGDILLFSIEQSPTHVAIFADVNKGTVVHTWRAKRNVVESRYGAMLHPSGVWRFPGVNTPMDPWV